MFSKLTVLACILSLLPSLAGAQEIAALVAAQPAQSEQRSIEPSAPVNLMPTEGTLVRMAAASEQQGSAVTEEQRARKTHSGLTFSEFVDVHFGGYRWVYWAVAGAILIAIHANAD